MPMIKISIAMATYNGARYRQAQLDSFAKQTCLPDELVVCDDGSSDKTLEILEYFAQTSSFNVRIFKNEENIGYAKNFEKTLALCTGNLIFISDQDDYWFPEKIEKMNDHFIRNEKDFVLQVDMTLTDKDLNPSIFTQLGNIRSMGFTDETFVSGCGTALKREWLDLVLPFPQHVEGHDNWIHRLACALNVRAIIDTPLQYYRRHDNNASQWHASKPGEVGRFSAIRAHGLDSAIAGWSKELMRIEATSERIKERTELLGAMGIYRDREQAIKKLESQMCAYRNRIKLGLKSRPKRIPMLFNMLIKGDYRHFSGWKSAIKDMIRP
jgi:glycosyltransferase involved in cell wall biosynthesis